jgi:predicted NAD/FAD-dependent oxidoreductase
VAEKLSKPRYVGVPLMRTLAEALATELECRMLHRVTQVSRLNEKWSLAGNFENEGKIHSFSSDGYDFVVFSLPPAQAAVLSPHPRLAQSHLMPCCALLLSFERRIEVDFDGIKLDDAVISWLGRDTSKPGRSTGERWVIHGSPDWSKEYFEREADEIKNLLTERFATIFDIKFPAISFAKLHKWKFALPISPPAWGCIIDRQAAAAYCGDWCMSARIEGAFLSGLSAADEILKIKNLL